MITITIFLCRMLVNVTVNFCNKAFLMESLRACLYCNCTNTGATQFKLNFTFISLVLPCSPSVVPFDLFHFQLCPKFLHSNSTSHKRLFGAIAELIDNAYDPDVNAKQFWIDKTMLHEQVCLTFMDNGNGMDLEKMRKMLSFGFSDKVAVKGVVPIGIYGNGFKSGAMRLGRDAIVFSKSKATSCIGMLSQSYLEGISAEQIMVPIVSFKNTETNFSVAEEQQASLDDILRYSPFQTVAELLTEVNAIRPPFSQNSTGTRILIWNLPSTSTGTTEFDFETDRYDIRLRLHTTEVKSYVPESELSLRAYCSILYLKPRTQINVRGRKVNTQLITNSLAFIKKDSYKPCFLGNKRIPITFGYSTKSRDHCGIMMYHKNRLIKAYKRVGGQLRALVKGLGVIGVIDCNFLELTQNKQSFSDNDKYRKTINSLAIKLDEYWKEIAHRRMQENPNNTIPVEDATKRAEISWMQCDDCLKWRKQPDGISSKGPEKWFCYLNPDPEFRSCEAEEESEDSEDEQPYSKTYKQHERTEKMNQEGERKRLEDEQKRQEKERLAALKKQNLDLMRWSADLKRQLRGTRKTQNKASVEGAIPSTYWATGTTRGKSRREGTEADTSESTPKRPRVNALQRARPHSNPLTITFSDKDNTDGGDKDDDEDVIILGVYTPSSEKPDNDLIKTEQKENDADPLMENFAASEENGPGSGSAGLPSALFTAATQTEVPSGNAHGHTSEVQKLHKLMQTTAQERDLLKEQVAQLTDQLQSMETRLQVSQATGSTHQPEEAEEARHYRSLLEEANQKIDELVKEKEASMNAPKAYEEERKQENDEIALQVDHLYRQLDQSNRERDELRSQLARLEEEKANLISQCEELKLSLQRQSSHTEGDCSTPHTEHNSTTQAVPQDSRGSEAAGSASSSGASRHLQCEELKLSRSTSRTARNSPTQAVPQEARGTGAFGTASIPGASRSLVQLRQNVGHLLSYFVPALDLDQVNYECDVIDEILVQVLSDEESIVSGLRSEAKKQ
ncbi:MORC family CW-type zinc finger protein 3-like isoform X1 [Genypterus blacodes]|uniref:MORC family CW-type zinc finger protein 3-like isoform X1 n=2 Tax=Genypterus blacodes TaxID=154954 RepID=UPI003F76DDFC